MQQQTWIDGILAMPWIAWSAGGLLVALGLVLSWRFLFSDRARGRRRCPKCWYDLRGTPGMRCSECGHEARRERALFRTRRRWRAGSAAILLTFAGVALAIGAKVRMDGWPSLLPTTALLWCMPPCHSDSSFGAVHWAETELTRRDAAASLWSWQWRYVLLHKNGLKFRRVWPADHPLLVEPASGEWSGAWFVRARSESDDLRMPGLPPDWFNGSAPVAPAHIDNLHPTKIDVAIETDWTGGPFMAGARCFSWTGQVELPIRFVPTIDQAMRRLSGREIDRAIQRALKIRLIRDREITHIDVALDRSFDRRLSDLAFGFSLTLCRDGRPVATTRLNNSTWPSWRSNPFGLPTNAISAGDASVAIRLDTSSEWTIEVRGDPDQALCDWEKLAYWDGLIHIRSDQYEIDGFPEPPRLIAESSTTTP